MPLTTVRFGLYLDGEDITNYANNIAWDQNSEAVFNTISFNLIGLRLLEKLDPESLRATPRLLLRVGKEGSERDYNFILELRNTKGSVGDVQVAVRGRDDSAILDKPHNTGIDVDVQTLKFASEVADEIITEYWKANGLSWDVDEYKIFPGEFTQTDQTPISIIKRLADTVGAGVRYSIEDNKLHVWRKNYQLIDAMVELEINDLYHIEKHDDSVANGEGFNKVRVVGWGEGENQISVEAETVPGEPNSRYINVYAEPVSLLTHIQMSTTDGVWVIGGNGFGKNKLHQVTEELWDFRGPIVEAAYPVVSAPAITWHGPDTPTLKWTNGYRTVELVNPTEDETYMSIGTASYTTKRNRFKLIELSKPITKVMIWYEELEEE